MSLRIPLRRLVAPLRSFSTAPRALNAASTSQAAKEAGSSQSGGSGSGSDFDDLGAILSGVPGTHEVSQALAESLPTSSATSAAVASGPPTIVDPSARRGYTPHAVPPDTHPLLDLFTNLLMKHGRKAEAQARVSRLLSLIQGAANANPVPLLQRAVTLSSPSIRVVSSRARAKTVQTPLALTERQRTRQGIMWILKAAEKGRKGGVARETRIAREVLAVLEGNSDVFKWLEEKHKVATANRSNLNRR